MAYLNTIEVESAIAALAKAYPSLTELITLPNTTVEGRTCTALRVGTRAAHDTLLVTGAVHAREWGGSDICVAFAADLLESYTHNVDLRYGDCRVRASTVRRIVETMNVLVFPQVNPDGRHYSQTVDTMWRRNRNTAYAHNHARCVGVDINRNHDFLWDFQTTFDPKAEVGTSANPCASSQTWCGPSANSEPETRNIHALFDRYPQIRWYIDLHSYGPLVLYPWGDDENQTEDPSQSFRNAAYDGMRGMAGDTGYREYIPAEDLAVFKRLAAATVTGIRSVRGKAYEAQQAYHLYPTSGAGDDYAYSRHLSDSSLPRIYPFTIEFGDHSFAPPWDQMEAILGDITAGLLRFCQAALVGRRIGR